MRRLLQSATVQSSDHPFQVYYKLRHVLLQSATAYFITKCDGLLLQSATAFLLQSATGRSGEKWVEIEIPLFTKLELWISAQLISRNFAFFSFLGEH